MHFSYQELPRWYKADEGLFKYWVMVYIDDVLIKTLIYTSDTNEGIEDKIKTEVLTILQNDQKK